MILVRAAPLTASEVPGNGWSAVLDVGYCGVEDQYVVQHIFLLVFTWGPSLDLILATIGKGFCHYHTSLSAGWSVCPRELNPVGKPIIKYVSHHLGKRLEIAKAGSDTLAVKVELHQRRI